MLTIWARRWDMFKKFQYWGAKGQRKMVIEGKCDGGWGEGSQREKWFWLGVSKEKVVSELISRFGRVLSLFQNTQAHSKTQVWNWICWGDRVTSVWETGKMPLIRKEEKKRSRSWWVHLGTGWAASRPSGADCWTRITVQSEKTGHRVSGTWWGETMAQEGVRVPEEVLEPHFGKRVHSGGRKQS